MTDDLPTRLRRLADTLDRHPAYRAPVVREAAVEIERLRAERVALRKALKETTSEAVEHRQNIIECHNTDPRYMADARYREAYDQELARMDGVIERARKAMETKTPQTLVNEAASGDATPARPDNRCDIPETCNWPACGCGK